MLLFANGRLSYKELRFKLMFASFLTNISLDMISFDFYPVSGFYRRVWTPERTVGFCFRTEKAFLFGDSTEVWRFALLKFAFLLI
jgi:hypothetical protein